MLSLKLQNNTNIFAHQLEDKTQRKKIEDYSYGLYDKIGKGFSSIVYKGRNDVTGQIVAIKVIDMKGVKDEFGRQMLDCQIEALKTLNHSNILKCFDVFTTVNNCYIITELCNEGDLAALLSKRKKLNENEALKFIKDICEGFFEIAGNNFLHRDLKLANIFMKDGIAKIADFGFAKKNKNPGQKEKYNVGSPLYMPPEALKNNIYSIKSDIWSVGVIIYELLHGETPWECKTERELLEKISRVPVSFKSLMSDQLKDFIRKCLEVDEHRRFNLEQMKSHPLINKISTQKDIKIPENKERQRALSLINKPSQTYKPLTKKDSNKQNIGQSDAESFTKNNDQIVQYINIFRLLYKIAVRLKQSYPQQKPLIDSLSETVLNKINSLKIISQKPSKSSLQNSTLTLKNIQSYFNLASNPSIKKYLRVINDYHKKYNEDLSHYAINSNSNKTAINSFLIEFLKSNVIKDDEITLFHWISQYLTLPKDIKKDVLENIVEPKNKLQISSIRYKIQKILQ